MLAKKVWFVFLLFFVPMVLNAAWEESQFQNTKILNFYPSGEGSSKKALMIHLHGCGQKNWQIRDLVDWPRVANNNDMIVSLPQVPKKGVYGGCWDFFGRQQSSKRPHISYLLAWIDKLLQDENINRNKIFLSGFSSGGAMAMVVSCLRPDLIAGLGVNSAPALGTQIFQLRHIATSHQKAAALCEKWAGKRAEKLSALTASIIVGDSDPSVHAGYSQINADMYQSFANSPLKMKELNLTTLSGANRKGSGKVFFDSSREKVSLIVNHGLEHNIPSGTGLNATDGINGNSIDYPKYLTEFLLLNQRE